MIAELTHAQSILKKILYEYTPFSQAVSEVFSTLDLPVGQLNIIRGLCSCTLHHEKLLNHFVNRYVPHLFILEKLLLMIAIGNNMFIKRLNSETIQQFLKDQLNECQIEPSMIKQMLASIQPGASLIDPRMDKQSVAYLSIMYNTPAWLVSMWIKHFSMGRAIKLLKANTRPVYQSCRVLPNVMSVETIVKNHHDMVAGPVPHTVIYEGKKPLKLHPLYTNHVLFSQRLALSKVIQSIDFSQVYSEVLIVDLRPQAVYLELALLLHHPNQLHVITNSIQRKMTMQKTAQSFQLKGIKFYEAEPTAMLTHIGQPQDVVFVMPACSKFDLIRSLPDFFVHFHASELDQLIHDQYVAIEASGEFVCEGGLLVYTVNTLNHKEGTYLIQKYMQAHPEFSLVSEQYYFPYDKYNTALYSAILRKKKVEAS
jgi:16S rRNA C967 or C1407 C5-methylase (RsmB/RsmF family)